MPIDPKQKRPKRFITHCKACREATTHEIRVDPTTGETKNVCLCCDSAKYRTKEMIRKIRKVRKGWRRNRL